MKGSRMESRNRLVTVAAVITAISAFVTMVTAVMGYQKYSRQVSYALDEETKEAMRRLHSFSDGGAR